MAPEIVKKRQKTGGRKKGSRNRATVAMEQFDKAIKKDAKEHDDSIQDAYLRMARTEPTVMNNLMSKLMPNLTSVTVKTDVEGVGYAAMTPSEACAQMTASTIGQKKESL